MMVTSGAQAPVQFERLAARLKSCPDTCFVVDTFTAAAKAVLIEAEDAGINACSTLRWIANGKIRKGMNACSTPWGKNFQGLKPQIFSQLDAALKGRSSTMQSATMGVR
jgi:hypothetical protein